MWSHKSSNRRAHAQSTYQSLPEQSTGRPAIPGTGASGMSSPSEPSGVLSQFAARPSKLRRTEASGVLPAPNGTSISFPFALEHDDQPPNSHLHQSPLWRADAPEPQGATEQRPASADVAVNRERRAPADLPSTLDAGSSSLSAQRSRLFAKLKDKMQSGTGPSGFDKLCRADKELITEFVEGAEKGEGSFTTVNGYLSVLINFGKWLSQENKGSLQSFVSKDKNTQTADTSNFQKWTKGARLAAALTHLRQVASPTHEPIKIRSYSRHKATEGDEAFINNALSTMPDYAASLRGLSEWLYINRKEPLCKPGRLHSQALRDDAKAFATTRLGGSQKAVRALWQLETFYDTGKTDVVKRLNTRNLPKDDQQLIEQYKHKLWVASDGKTYPNKETYAGKKSSYARRFSAWLQAQGKDSMASRLHDPTLDTDLDLYKATKESIYHCDIISMLRQVREMPTPNVQPPGLGSSAEPSGSSYPSMVAPTHSGGAPQTSHSWDLNISAEELVGPSGSAPPEPQAPQRSWDLNMPAAEVSGASGSAQSEPSSSTLAFNRDALHPEATGPQRTTAMSQASLPTFNEDDTGPN